MSTQALTQDSSFGDHPSSHIEGPTSRASDGSGSGMAAPGRDAQARAWGGDIDITCSVKADGILTVKANNWSGWSAGIDGAPAELNPGQWLSVELPAGVHMVRFRYRPWDVWFGVALTLFGVALATFLWRRPQAMHADCANVASDENVSGFQVIMLSGGRDE